MTTKAKFTIVFFMFVTFFTVLEMNIVLPLAPAIAKLYHIPLAYISLLNLGYSMAGLLAPIFGYYSDRYNMKAVILVSLLIFSLGCLILIGGRGMISFVLGRTIIGLSYYSIVGLTASYTAGVIPAEKIGYVGGWYKLAFGLGIVVSPLLGTWIMQNLGFSYIYVFLLAASILAAVGVFFLDAGQDNAEGIDFKEIISMIGLRKVRVYAFITFTLSVPAVLFYNYFSIHLELLSFSQIEIGQMYTLVSAGSVLAAILIILASSKWDKLNMALAGLAICVIFILPLALSHKIILSIASVFFGIGYDLIWGLHFPLSSLLFKRGNATFLTILSLSMAATNVITNLAAPIIFSWGGFSWNIFLSFLALLITLVLYWRESYSTS